MPTFQTYVHNIIEMYKRCLFMLILAILHQHLSQSGKPYSTQKQEVWRLECELGIITDAECPIDGGWSTWSVWSGCHGPCDDVGHRKRTRECNNPPTSRDGTPCVGADEQIEACFITNCSLEDFRKLVRGDASRSEALDQLQIVPALLERCLQMECPYEAVEAALAYDNTWQLNSEELWNALQCVKHNIGCPVKGEWGVWGSWSACGSRCGKGTRWRLRRCDTPPPSAAFLCCSGTPLQSEVCEGDQCAMDDLFSKNIARGTWSEWSQWSRCSEICGSGVRRRKRTCIESHIRFSSITWGTHCRGQHDQLEVCIKKDCSLDGGWSGWGPWGPCSQTCGVGQRSRIRTCTKPVPSGVGKNCDGSKMETSSCYLDPCKVYTHLVAAFNGDSYLQYNLSNKKSTLFHFYIRFRPLSPSGTLVRRGALQSPYIRLSLQKWHVCLDACGMSQYCGLSRVCSSITVGPAIWHTALIAVSSESAIIRLDNALTSIKGYFPCDPELENSAINIYVGERFNGEIQELILNFHPLTFNTNKVTKVKGSDLLPTFSSNVVYEKANLDEAYLIMENNHFIRLPCFKEQNEWRLEVTVKPKGDSGIILFLFDDNKKNWLYVALQNMRLKIKIAIGEFRSESSSSFDYPPNQWLDITLCKHKEMDTIESVINGGEKLHLFKTETIVKKPRQSKIFNNKQVKNNHTLSFCNDEFFIGNVPVDVKNQILEDFAPFSGLIASLNVNGVLLDLHNCSLERYNENKIQLSSRTASVSRAYIETGWGESNSLNLTCLRARFSYHHNTAHWLQLDTSVDETLSSNNIKFTDDGRKLKLISTVDDNNLKGFYTCREHSITHTYNVVTYGVLGKLKYDLSSPDLTTIIAVFTTVTLVACTLSWLVWEGINDFRSGYGFFRDAHFSPQEEAEAVCKYIDQNRHFFTSTSAIKLAKVKARRRGQRLASKVSFGAQEPQGLLQMQSEIPEASNESASSDLDTLPALPEIKDSHLETSHDVYRCEIQNVSSARYDSSPSSDSKLTSYEMSPRVLCSHLVLGNYKHTSKHNIRSRRDRLLRYEDNICKNTRKHFSTKCSTLVNLSPAQKVLQKFNELKSHDL